MKGAEAPHTSHVEVDVLRLNQHSEGTVVAFPKLNTLAPVGVRLELFHFGIQTHWLLTFLDDADLTFRVDLYFHDSTRLELQTGGVPKSDVS